MRIVPLEENRCPHCGREPIVYNNLMVECPKCGTYIHISEWCKHSKKLIREARQLAIFFRRKYYAAKEIYTVWMNRADYYKTKYDETEVKPKDA